MDIDQFKEDVREGRVDLDRVAEVIDELQRRLEQANKRVEELEKKLGGSPTQKVDQAFSVDAEERRQAARGKGKKRKKPKKGRKGRKPTAEKVAQAERVEEIYPEGAAPEKCRFSHERVIWRLEQGRAVLVAYRVYRRGRRYGQIPGAMGRSEFGEEIVIALAYQVYFLGLSFDKACELLGFFLGLTLSKSQADSLMYHLAGRWEEEFETLCLLLAHSAVVYADETSWSIRNVWAFLSEKARVLLFGVRKDGATLREILDPETFDGVMVSDHAAVYGRFSKTQKCWAHVLRKAIRLTLLEPENATYRDFADTLLGIYRKACRVKKDRRLSPAGRDRKVDELRQAVMELYLEPWLDRSPPADALEADFRRLVNELVDLMFEDALFTFVTEPGVEGTNNESERTLRGSAEARKTGRTSKTLRGARRKSILTSVLESLRLHLPEFTLGSVVAEVVRWSQAGRSCFSETAEQLGLGPPDHSVLDRVMPTGC